MSADNIVIRVCGRRVMFLQAQHDRPVWTTNLHAARRYTASDAITALRTVADTERSISYVEYQIRKIDDRGLLDVEPRATIRSTCR